MLGLLATVGGVFGARYLIAAIPAPATTLNRMVSAGVGMTLALTNYGGRSFVRNLALGAGIGGLSAAVLWPANDKKQKAEDDARIEKEAREVMLSQMSQLGCATCRMPADTVRESLDGCMPCMAAAMLADQYSDEELLTNSATMFNV